MTRMKDIPKADLPREKALLYGISSLSNAELLAIIISNGTKKSSALDISYEMLSRFRGIRGICKASVKDLCEIEGINKAKALKLIAAFTLYERAIQEEARNNVSLKGKEAIAFYFHERLYSETQEKAFVVIVNGKNKVLSISELFRGSLHKLVISPQLVIKEVIDKGTRFILIHNHPSNLNEASDEDRITTSGINMLACQFGLEMVDHLVITKDGYYSINENREYTY